MSKARQLRPAGLSCFGAGRAPLPRIPIFSRQFSASLIERIKGSHGEEDLDDLLRHIYTAYPEFAIRSEILDRVVGRRGLA